MIRADSFNRLVELARAAAGGSGGAVLVVGEAGAGKTVLGERLRAALDTDRRVRAIATRAVPAEQGLTYGGLHDVLLPLLGDAGRLHDVHRRVLLTALGYDLGPAVEPLTLRVAVLSLLAAAASTSPLLLVVDDVHWLDAPSRAVLGFCARRLAHDPVLLVLTMRSGYDHADLDGAEVLALGPLPMAERREVVRLATAGALDEARSAGRHAGWL